jgi:NAD(P)-dependent dehydrogenase (short-subunit alcohol dehydrogenase family)
MLDRGTGSILNTSSPGALWGSPLGTSYAASKGAIWSLTRCLYKEVYEAGITVNTIVPGANTNREPDKRGQVEVEAMKWLRLGSVRSGEPVAQRVGPIAAYLVSDEARDITGRTVYAAGNTVALFEEPQLVNTLILEGGWTTEALRRALHAVVPSGLPSPYQGDRDPANRARESVPSR